ncbi:hypothetical protein NDN08_003915 [Rhodosorus marinus]|uniref:Uncharacterized protein n=1 Tax=Rhodosorus marinus TaxID=101924 RepID=A0AAV8UGT9_9RHOD|nr:hypothetical protein NDN08_003915 [Rhodosorus marinus]
MLDGECSFVSPASWCNRHSAGVGHVHGARPGVPLHIRRTSASRLGASTSEAYTKGFFSVEEDESSYEIAVDSENVYGRVPEDLNGTLFRVMPGKVDSHGDALKSYYDGDGMVVGISFGEDAVFVRHRCIRTKAYDREKRRKKRLYRGLYGSVLPGGNLANFAVKIKQTANRFGVNYGGRLLALNDWGLPYSVDPASLLTRGNTNLRTELDDGDKMIPSSRICKDNLILASKSFTPFGMSVRFTEFKGDYRLVGSQSAALTSFLTQDFAVTEKYFVIVQPALSLDLNSLVLGSKKTYQEALSPKGKTSQIVVVDRKSGASKKIDLQDTNSVIGRIANAYDEVEGNVTIDAISHERVFFGDGLTSNDYANDVPRSKLVRIRVDVQAKTSDLTVLSDYHCDYPVVDSSDGRMHKHIYSLSNNEAKISPPRGIMKTNPKEKTNEVWVPESPSQYCSAPAFAPREGATDSTAGYIVTVVFDSETEQSSVAILDSEAFTDGPVCWIRLESPVPHGVCSSWSNSVYSIKDAKKTNSFEIFKDKGWNTVDSGFSMIGMQGFEDEF